MTPEQERVWKLATAEFNEIHSICDLAGVPRTTPDGAKFSVAQRVRGLATAWEATRGALRKAAGEPNTSN